MATTAIVLTPNELWFIECVGLGKIADFSTRIGQRPIIRAIIIRRLLLGLEFHANDATGTLYQIKPKLPAGINAKHFDVTGVFEIDDVVHVKGRHLPALLLDHVNFLDGTISARHVKFTRLEIKNSKFRSLNLEDSQIFGDLDLSGAGPLNHDAKCVILGHGLHVEGTVRIARGNLKLVSKPNRSPSELWHYALDFLEAKIQGSLILEPYFKALGGVRIGGANISGWVQLAGAKLDAIEGFALHANGAKIGGTVNLSAWQEAGGLKTLFTSRGKIYLQGSTIGGSLKLEGVELSAHQIPGLDGSDEALDCANTTIGLDVTLNGKVTNNVDFKGISVRGCLHLTGLQFDKYLPLLGKPVEFDIRDSTIYRITINRLQNSHILRNSEICAFVLLRGARCTFLDDYRGAGWGYDVRLQIAGFEYTQFSDEFVKTPPLIPGQSIWKRQWKNVANILLLGNLKKKRQLSSVGHDRADWIYRQTSDDQVRAIVDPLPYEHLMKVLKNAGAWKDAEVVHRKLAAREARTYPFLWQIVYRFIFGGIYGYGTRSGRAILALICFVSCGTLATCIAQDLDLLVVDSQPITTHALLDDRGRSTGAVTHTMPDRKQLVDDPYSRHDDPYRRHEANLYCSTEVTPWVFALDRAIPLIELREQGRCYMRPPTVSDGPWPWHSPWLKEFWVHPTTWRWGLSLYTLVGWLLSSLTVLTITDVYRRFAWSTKS